MSQIFFQITNKIAIKYFRPTHKIKVRVLKHKGMIPLIKLYNKKIHRHLHSKKDKL